MVLLTETEVFYIIKYTDDYFISGYLGDGRGNVSRDFIHALKFKDLDSVQNYIKTALYSDSPNCKVYKLETISNISEV